MTASAVCEACRSNPVEIVIDDDDPIQPYRVCSECADRLYNLALRPLEWFNLAALHSIGKFHLHDDFYTDFGVAQQPRTAVLEPNRFPSPTLNDVRNSPDRLLDYAMTLWLLDPDTIEALSRHDKELLLARLQERVAAWPNVEIEARAYEICAQVIGANAADWIRERWKTWNRIVLLSLAAASAACLPFPEGFERVSRVFEKEPSATDSSEDLSDNLGVFCHAFVPFRSPATLDWMEAHTEIVSHQNWGRVAAQSHFSWPRAAKWLERGRPLSHIALFAILSCYRYDTPDLKQNRPKLEEPESADAMLQRLDDYAQIDRVPRVRNLIASIRTNMQTN